MPHQSTLQRHTVRLINIKVSPNIYSIIILLTILVLHSNVLDEHLPLNVQMIIYQIKLFIFSIKYFCMYARNYKQKSANVIDDINIFENYSKCDILLISKIKDISFWRYTWVNMQSSVCWKHISLCLMDLPWVCSDMHNRHNTVLNYFKINEERKISSVICAIFIIVFTLLKKCIAKWKVEVQMPFKLFDFTIKRKPKEKIKRIISLFPVNILNSETNRKYF